jgi:hypothetical protein
MEIGPNAFSALGYNAAAIRWSGRPAGGIKFSGSDILMIPFSLMWGGFAIFWETMVVRGHAPIFMQLWGIPFVLVGLYIVVGRFFMDAYARANTEYALTDDSALIVRRGIGGRVSTVYLPGLNNMDLDVRPDGTGTITFGALPTVSQGMTFFGNSRTPVSPAFRYIPDAAEVFGRCKAAQRFRKDAATP